MRRPALKAALAVERVFERLFPNRAPGEVPVLEAYRGFATPEKLVLRGRVLTALRRTSPAPEASRWRNLRQMVSLFLTDEVRHVAAEARGVRAESDDEGYLWMEVPREDVSPGWVSVEVRLPAHPEVAAPFPVRVPDPAARLGVISDIDDTMMETGAYSIARNLWTTFTGSALTRRVFPDAVVLMDYLSDHGRNPVYYVSSSPWNLHAFLEKVFARAGLQRGPMFLRDLGLSEGGFFASGHGDHKGSAIDRIMAANPDLPFVLIGDTGQKDAEVYLQACLRHGGRIAGVILREPGPGPDDRSRAAIAEIRRLGVRVAHGRDFATVPDTLAAAGLRV
ncbi:Phosphatidate phosphatase APP1 [Tranquillimonas rosea]|uniref:Phosphatidate phosphatase APP1 n=1 Tax=Tranquillimonas rosea TaxID=641238 RepID=A0A1H9UKH2_9RHOB|nr:phosphatase domain-containing protein [Tranquillimonas rosea]SES09862.1 Phosphatidate phosphatase APP1 [Tranquillimonas rosea]